MLTGEGAMEKNKKQKAKKKHSQCDEEKSGEGNLICNEAKIITQNLYAI